MAPRALLWRMLYWKIKLRSWWQPVYWWRVLAVFLWPVAYFVPQHLNRTGHHPPIGTYIALAGLLVACVTLRKDPPVLEKACWIILFTMVTVAEIKNLYVADREQSSAFQSIRSGLGETKSGLDGTIRGLGAATSDLGKISSGITAASGMSQRHFEQTLSTLRASHKQDESEFEGIIGQEKELFKSQQDISEQFAGRLVPQGLPTPPNGCDTLLPSQIQPNTMTVLYGNGSAALTNKSAILKIANFPVISYDKKPNSDVYLSVDFRDELNRILLRVNGNGIVRNTPSLSVLRPDKSTLLVEDVYGREFFRITYINQHAFQLSGNIVYCGKALSFSGPLSMIKNSCTAYGADSVIAFTAAACPAATQP
ncbi:MAG TPA: hypothetical protein VK716_00595 [Terracidiphilus sp.]|jgi:hypothetical protein|nr:hypothetical protein [Terracidiphilus sp.]